MFANRSCHRPATCKAPAGGHGRERVRQSSECGSGRLALMHSLTWLAGGGMATSVRESRSWPAEMPASRRTAPDPRQARQWQPNLEDPDRNCAGLSGRPACDAAILRAVAHNGHAKRHRTGRACVAPNPSATVLAWQFKGGMPSQARSAREIVQTATPRRKDAPEGRKPEGPSWPARKRRPSSNLPWQRTSRTAVGTPRNATGRFHDAASAYRGRGEHVTCPKRLDHAGT